MRIVVNGESRSIGEKDTLAQLLSQLEMGNGRIAVELNGEIVPRSEFANHQLQDGDHLEIVQAIGGV